MDKGRLKDFFDALARFGDVAGDLPTPDFVEVVEALMDADYAILALLLPTYEAALRLDTEILHEGAWTLGEIHFHAKGSAPWRREDAWSPQGVGLPVEHLVEIHKALHPGFVFPGEDGGEAKV